MSKEPLDIIDLDSHAIAKKIFSRAALTKLQLMPEAYSVWFAYYANTHPKLTFEVDEVVASGKIFDTATHKELYKKYLQNNQDDQAATQQAISETHLLLKEVFDEILNANSATVDYGNNLQQHTVHLNRATSVADVKLIISNLLKETSAAVVSGKRLQDKLVETTAKAKLLEKQLQQTKAEANTDALTGLWNRKAFNAKSKELFDDFHRHGRYFSVIMVDIDFFKKFNDTYGHQTGDLVLQTVGKTLLRSLKGADFPARYGGEEFIVLLPETTQGNAITVAEQLRVRLYLKKNKDPNHPDVILQVSASFGVTCINSGDTMESLLGRADKALYRAKETGRNRVCSERDLC